MFASSLSFESMVESSWSLAVFEAAHRFAEFRPGIIAALSSPNGLVRSAAVAVLNEANDQDAHDQVLALISDPEYSVREEVLEYLAEFSVEKDAPALLQILKGQQHLFLASCA